ncbi:MAG: 3-methylornithine--L-lysine ligase PylC [Candidatus Omnitrophota bacterium]
MDETNELKKSHSPFRVAIIGGGLQGVEAVYLAHKAGWKVLLIDKKADAPASGCCDTFIQWDVTKTEGLDSVLKEVDVVIPALEDRAALDSLVAWGKRSGVPLAFDPAAYSISSSKLKSDRLFETIIVPAPVPWPWCEFPVIAKPSEGSGSKGIQIFYNPMQMESFFIPPFHLEGWVLQEYLEGPQFSLEVVGVPGHYSAIQVTDLEMDHDYDCKRVQAPSVLEPDQTVQFENISLHIAEAIRLHGLMDVEVILHGNQLKVLEIDARFPSQTPTAVYWSTGRNLLELLVRCFVEDKEGDVDKSEDKEDKETLRAVVYEHIRVSGRRIEDCGEHVMAESGPLRLHRPFFGADEAITNYEPRAEYWVATLIVSGTDRLDAWEKRNRVRDNIKLHMISIKQQGSGNDAIGK